MARLEVVGGNHAGETFDISENKIQIGRSVQNDIVLSDSSVSRKHAEVHRNADGTYLIKDNGSTYGTVVNGAKVTEGQLLDRAEIKLGGAVLRFNLEKSDVEREPEQTGETTIQADSDHFTVLYSLDDRKSESDEQSVVETRKRLEIALEVSALLNTAGSLNEVFERTLEETSKTVKARTACIVLYDENTGALEVVTGKRGDANGEEVNYSRSIVKQVCSTGVSLLTADAITDQEVESTASILSLGIRSAMCVPLQSQGQIVGALNVDAPGANAFNKEDLRLLRILGNIAGTALLNYRLQEESLRAARMAAIGQSMAGLAHDIKNIMAGIKGGAYMVDQGMGTKNDQMFTMGWDLVKVSQGRINQLVWNMLDYSKERKPTYEEVDLADTLQNVRDLVAARGLDRGMKVALEVAPEAATIEAEAISVHRCILNLASNALDALPNDREGHIVIRVRPDDQPEMVAIDVEDNGVGIPEDVLPRLFQPFSSTKGGKGTGLGLAVAQKIAREHGGSITVKSKEDEGTTFTVHLPRKRPEPTSTLEKK